MGDQRSKSEADILEMVKAGELFGLIEVDIHVSDNLCDKFSEMPPIFKNVSVSRENLSEHMKEFAANTDHLKSPQRMLIGSLLGEKVLLITPLLVWYLEHGLKVTKVHQVSVKIILLM